jgi:hypothetical protein
VFVAVSVAVAAAVAVAGCGDPEPRGCELGFEETLATADGPSFDDVALVRAPGGEMLALFSDRAGLHALGLDAEGRGRGQPRRIGPACPGGIAARAGRDAWVVACVGRSDAHHDDGVTLIELDGALATRRTRAFGVAGRDSRGVDVEIGAEGLIVAWHDGTPGAYRTWIAELPWSAGNEEPVPRLLSAERVAGGAPSLLRHGRVVLAAWSESWFDEAGAPAGQVVVGDGRGAPRQIADTRFAEPWPVLARERGAVLIGFRDERPPAPRAALYVQRLSETLQPRGEPVRVGLANALGRPYLLACHHGLVSVAPRRYGARDVLIGVHRLDARLERMGQERQIYEHGNDFSFAGAVCTRTGLQLLAAERGTAARPVAHVRTMSATCP